MTLNRTNTLLLILLVFVIAVTAASRIDFMQANIEILPDMKYTPAWAAYSKNPVFANGRTLQPPVAGTIARGQMPLHFEATKEDAVVAGEELINPYFAQSQSDSEPELLKESTRRGGEVYRVFCVSCHGPSGAGDGPVTQRGFPPPPSLLTGNSVKMKDGQLYHILTYGQGSMSDFAGQLSPRSRWDVINYVRGMQPDPSAQPSTPDDAETVTDADEQDQVAEQDQLTELESTDSGEQQSDNKPN